MKQVRSGLFLFVLGAFSVFAQELHVSSVIGKPGDKIALDLALQSSTGQVPTTLKWELVFPAQLLEPVGPPGIGRAAKESGKSLTCTSHGEYTLVCILAGGRKSIVDGTVAIFPFRIRENARKGAASVSVGKVDAITIDFKNLKLNGSEGRVEIH